MSDGILETTIRRVIREELAAVVAELRDRPEPAEWLTTAQAAAIPGWHPKTLQRKARAGEIPSTKVGTDLRFRRSDLEAYLERGGRR